MRVLFVTHFYPWPLDNGTRQRVYHLLRAFRRRHRVTLVALAAPARKTVPAGELPAWCERIIEVDITSCAAGSTRRLDHWAPALSRVGTLFSSPLPNVVRQWDSPALYRVLCRLRRRERFDAVWVERSYIAETVRRAGFERVVVDVDDLESVSLARLLRSSDWYRSKPLHYAELLKVYAYERSLPVRFRRLVVCKEQDRLFFGGLRRRVWVVPNGVRDYPAAPAESERAGELLFAGTMYHGPNIDAVRFFHTAILPAVRSGRPDAYLAVVGQRPVPAVQALHDGISCKIYGGVPDMRPHYETAAVVVAPIRLGSGTRLKVLEALGRGKAVVATSTAAEGLDLRPGIDLEIADTPEPFAAACLRLLGDPAARRRLGEAGRRRVLARYRWDAIGEIAEQVLADAASSAC